MLRGRSMARQQSQRPKRSFPSPLRLTVPLPQRIQLFKSLNAPRFCQVGWTPKCVFSHLVPFSSWMLSHTQIYKLTMDQRVGQPMETDGETSVPTIQNSASFPGLELACQKVSGTNHSILQSPKVLIMTLLNPCEPASVELAQPTFCPKGIPESAVWGFPPPPSTED